MKLGDLIEVPPIRTVIQLADTQRQELQGELLDSFVFTQDILELFRRLLLALSKPTGLGVFLKGHYGSGKSHCLAFLQQMLSGNPRAWQRLPEDIEANQVQQKSWIVVSVPLFAYSAEHTLEQVVMQALEDELARHLEHPPVLAESSRLLENFCTYILPVYRTRLHGFEELDPVQQVQRARQFLRELPENPLRLSYDRRQSMAQLGEVLQGRQVVLLLDELSEFLRSKKADSAPHREDIRFLQFLGEWSDKLPLWIVASLQHTLEELDYGEESSALRIRERYPLRFQLSTRHVSDLIAGRLIRHKPGAETHLRKLWQDLERLYPGLISQSEFLRTYPVHPVTLQMLETLTPLFSRQRGVVDFVHTRLAGDPLRGVSGILDGPSDQLLTAETLFDHFREHFSDRSELAPYESTCWTYFERELPALFEDDKSRQVAAAVVKVLILAAISPVPQDTSAEKLSLILARRLSLLNPKTNLQYLQEKVMDPLTQRAAYVICRGDQYRLDLQSNLNQILGQRVREALQRVRPDWEAALHLVNRPQLPLAEILGRPPQNIKLRWRQAPREGLWAWLHGSRAQTDLLSWQALLDSDKVDCCLVMLSPGLAVADMGSLMQSLASQPHMVFWKPAATDRDLEELLSQWLAHSWVLEQDRELRERLKPIVQGLGQRLEQRLYSLYALGTLHWAGQSGHPACHEMRFDRLYAAAVADGLERRFPDFASIAPRLEGPTGKHLKAIWQGLIEPGMGPSSAEVEGVMVPLRLVETFEGQMRLALQPGGPALALLDSLQPETRYAVHTLRRQWQKSSWGLVPGQFYLILASLVQLGKIQLYAHGRAFTLGSLDELLAGKAEELQVLSVRALPSVEELQPLQWMFGETSLVPLSQNKLRDLWREARLHLDHLHSCAEGLLLELSRNSTSFSGAPLQQLGQRAQELKLTLLQVGQPHSSLQGIQNLIDHKFARFEGLEQELSSWLQFLSHQGQGLKQTRRRLELLGQPELVNEIDEVLHSPEPWTYWPALREKAEHYETERSRSYREGHQAYYQLPLFQARHSLLQSPEWQALEALDRVLGFQSKPSLASLRQRCESLPKVCRANVEEQLLLGVVCRCGYRLGQEPPEVPDLLFECRQALSQGCRHLLEHDLGPHLRSLRKVGQERVAQKLESLLEALEKMSTSVTAGLCTQVLERLDASTQQHLSQALTGQTLLVARPIQGLLDRILDQRLPVSQLRRSFEDWLQAQQLSGDAWIHVHSGRQEEGAGPWLALWLSQHQLEVTAALARRFELQGEVQGQAPEEELWPTLLEQSQSLEPARAAIQERLFPRLSEHFCRAALRSGLPSDWGRRLPALDWPHLGVYRQIAGWLEASDFFGAARAWRDYQRLLYESEEPLEDCLEGLLLDVLAGQEPEAIPLGEGPSQLLQDCSQPWIILVVDGLRWDLWDLMRKLFEGRLGPPRRELLVRTPLPSNTQSARHAWLAGEELVPAGADGLLLGRPLILIKSADEKRKQKLVLEKIQQGLPALMLHLQFVDRRAHQSELELWPLYRELLEEAEVRLKPLLKAIPAGRAVVLLSDHGFRDPGRGGPAHGGDHWQETVVPAVLWHT